MIGYIWGCIGIMEETMEIIRTGYILDTSLDCIFG